MGKVVLHRHAARYLSRLPKKSKDQVKEKLKDLENNPLGQKGVSSMAGEWSGYYRLRIRDLRIIFWYDRDLDLVYVDHIGPRGDVYK